MAIHCVILFADLAGSVQLYRQVGDEAAKGHILDLQRLLTAGVEKFNGHVQEIIGDELLARFDKPDDALGCATALHQCAETYSGNHLLALHLRIGLHYGPVIVDETEKRLFGDTINIASRVTNIAQADQTITTDALVQHASSTWRANVRLFDVTPVKGIQGSLVVYDLPWKHDDLTHIITSGIQADDKQTSSTSLSIVYKESLVKIADSSSAFVIGRAITNDLVVNADSVSRRHVSIERRRNHFILTEQSTNGTHLYLDSGETLYLRREQFTLTGRGEIALGAPREAGDDHILRFTSGNSTNLG
jgi:class 3 adenylate cyclase